MKKRIIFYLTGLILCMLSLTFAGCQQKETVEKTTKKTIIIADFEKYDDIYNFVKEYNNTSFIGSYTLSSLSDREDKVKALSGDSSLEVHITGMRAEDYYGYDKNAGNPAHFYYNIFRNTKNDGDWGVEWKYLTKTSIDVYNDNDFEIHVAMCSVFGNFYPYGFASVTVPAKSTATLEMNVNRYFMQGENIKPLELFGFEVDYDRVVLEDGSLYHPEAYVYFDNFTAEFDTSSVYDEDKNAIVKKVPVSENEILAFNDIEDLQYMRELGHLYVKESDNEWNTVNWYEGIGSSYHYNTNPKYVHEGNTASLEWRVNPTFQMKYGVSSYRYLTDQNYMYGGAMTGITVCGDYLNYFNFSRLQEENTKILVDVYNAGKFDKEVGFGIYDYSGVAKEVKTELPYNYGATANYNQWYRLKAGEWTTLELTDFSYLDMSEGLARLWLVTSTIDVNEPISFYVNNLRIEYDGVPADLSVAEKSDKVSEDTYLLRITPSYTYKIVKVGQKVQLPEVEVSKNNVEITYTLDGERVAAGSEFVAKEKGSKELVITAKDTAGNQVSKKVRYTVTNSNQKYHTVYDFESVAGLETHMGHSFVNKMAVRLVDFSGEIDLYDKSMKVNPARSAVEKEMYQKGITSGIRLINDTNLGRITLTNPVNVDWSDQYESLYFYFYNAGYGSVTINFNNYSVSFNAKTGWQKVVIGAREVGTKTITDYSLISAEGNATTVNGMVDLEDCEGTFMMFSSLNNVYEEFAMTSIYGVPKNK